MDLKYRILLNP